ncbi:CPBP family intramembrane glutamic endopeptidase [Salinimicrobium oceani]|uniref:CPBP family intramembrane metalloprotease n=1 Tax=Salinimicrobium oceani TaxID=2722702 RepID=A0ABX1CWW7_9FLAO|nr:CPBP family intramembrane glutamic endopeptidase [Salinimicrobium oceani]NJW52425.1 CPBP family intramembrane metalloprotease [Salinimicrobium oceani]
MAGIIAELLISWLLLWGVEKKSLLALGLFPVGKRAAQLLSGFFLAALLCLALQVLEKFISASNWVFNPHATPAYIFSMFYWDLKSVLFEELIFRGAILYILLRRLGNRKGILISAIAFGIYHWFSFGIFGNLVPMLVIFIGTGLMGYALAHAFSRTGSIALPIGLHLGWNFTLNTIFSRGPLGDGLLLVKNGQLLSDYFSLIGLWLVPLVVLTCVYFFPAEQISTEKCDKITF